MAREAKRSVYEVIVVPTLWYANEVWGTSAGDIRSPGMCGVSIMN
jgi:hypothetical protein